MTSSQTTRRGGVVAAAGCALVLALAGCGSGDAPATPATTAGAAPAAYAESVIAAPELTAGAEIPAPDGKAVITVTGKISQRNQGKAVALDMAGLGRMGVVQIRVHEPWTKEDLDFRGVWLDGLLDMVGAAPDATTVHLVALDDYAVDLPMAEVREGGVLIALSDGDGADLPIDQGGPTRIIYRNGVASGDNPDQWIWSLKTIDVR
jgi:hypothetical protein